jgi:hypothetical protein
MMVAPRRAGAPRAPANNRAAATLASKMPSMTRANTPERCPRANAAMSTMPTIVRRFVRECKATSRVATASGLTGQLAHLTMLIEPSQAVAECFQEDGTPE